MLWMITILLLIGTAVAAYEDIIATRPLCLKCWAESTAKAVLIGIIPIAGMVMTNRYRWLKRHLEEAHRLSGDLAIMNEERNQTVVITSSNKDEDLELELKDLLFVSALGNYVEVHHLKDSKAMKTVLRTSLNAVDEQLTEHERVFRGHRAFLINLDRVKSIEGNAGGYELTFGYEGLTANIAKRKTAEFRSLMSGK